MKAILIILTFFVCSGVAAQDGYNLPNEHYQNIKALTEDLSRKETRELSIFLIESTPHEYSFLQEVETSRSITYVFNLVEEEISRFGASVTTIQFRKDGDSYDFQSLKVHSEASDAIYIWVRVFLPTATFDHVRENYKYRDLIHARLDIRMRLLNGDEIKSFKKPKRTKY